MRFQFLNWRLGCESEYSREPVVACRDSISICKSETPNPRRRHRPGWWQEQPDGLGKGDAAVRAGADGATSIAAAGLGCAADCRRGSGEAGAAGTVVRCARRA